MRKILIITNVLFATLILSACEFHQSVNKDLLTGAYSRGDGLGVRNVVIEINGKTENRNTFTYGEKVNFLFNGVTGFKKEKNKAFPGLSMRVLKNEEETVLFEPNLLSDLEDGIELSPLQLKTHLLAALPHRNNEKYKVHINIWDQKGDGTFSYEIPFTVEANKLLNITTSKHINYSNIYLWNETLKQTVLNNEVDKKDTLILLLEDIDGFEVKDEKIYPIFSINLEDGKGNKIISSPNILSKYEQDGINFKESNQLSAKIFFDDKTEINNPYKLTATLKDKNSTRKIKVRTELQIK